MKKLFQTIKLRRLKTELTKDSLKQLEGNEFYILYSDGSYECGNLFDVKWALKKDHIKPIRYIFDATDRIVIQRDVQINTDIDKEE